MTEISCPYCGDKTGNLNSHIRMSAGIHADQHNYPEDYNPDEKERGGEPAEDWEKDDLTDPPEEPTETAEESTGELDLDVLEDEPEEEEDEIEEIGFADSQSEARNYECGNCDEPLKYLGGDDMESGGKECPECGEQIFWSMVE